MRIGLLVYLAAQTALRILLLLELLVTPVSVN